jgi:endo-1,4-beta-D-glucanase Y
MADVNLQNQFINTLRASKSFGLLKPEEQNGLLQAFGNATDEQLKAGLAELQLDAMRQQQIEMQTQEQDKKLAKEVEELKTEMKEIDKEGRKEDEVKESEESGKEADKLLASLSKIDEKPKKKKFLGIF